MTIPNSPQMFIGALIAHTLELSLKKKGYHEKATFLILESNPHQSIFILKKKGNHEIKILGRNITTRFENSLLHLGDSMVLYLFKPPED